MKDIYFLKQRDYFCTLKFELLDGYSESRNCASKGNSTVSPLFHVSSQHSKKFIFSSVQNLIHTSSNTYGILVTNYSGTDSIKISKVSVLTSSVLHLAKSIHPTGSFLVSSSG